MKVFTRTLARCAREFIPLAFGRLFPSLAARVYSPRSIARSHYVCPRFTRTLARIAREFIPLLAALARTMFVCLHSDPRSHSSLARPRFTRTLARCARELFPVSLRSTVVPPFLFCPTDQARRPPHITQQTDGPIIYRVDLGRFQPAQTGLRPRRAALI